MPFYNDTLWRPEEMNSRRPSLKAKQSLPTSGTPNGLGWEHADVRLPPSANLNPMHQVWRPNPHHTGPGQRFQFPASSHPPLICFLPQSSQQDFPRREHISAHNSEQKKVPALWNSHSRVEDGNHSLKGSEINVLGYESQIGALLHILDWALGSWFPNSCSRVTDK